MDLQIILLGVIQGITEFLPISSSGHLVLIQSIYGFKEMLFYDVLLHFATVVAIFAVFFNELIGYFRNLKLVSYIIILTIPTGIIGLIVKKYFSYVYNNLLLSGIFLSVTGMWLFITENKYEKKASQKIDITNIKFLHAIVAGIAQGVAVLPGISRSAAMLGSMLGLGVNKQQSVKFVFIAGIPAILAATLLEVKELISTSEKFETVYLFGMLASFVVGLISLKFLVKFVTKYKLKTFSYYCWAVSCISIVLYFVKNFVLKG